MSEHKVTVRHPERADLDRNGRPYSEYWVAVCTCGWFTDYKDPSEYTRLREAGDAHELLYGLEPSVRQKVQLHAFTVIEGRTSATGSTRVHAKCGACGWVGPEHNGEGANEKANADASAHYAAEIKKATG